MEPLGIPAAYWRSRTPVRRGHIDPPNFGRLIGSRSTVEGRIAEQKFHLEQADRDPQLKPGMLVIHEREPFRIVDIREYPADIWPQNYQDAWDKHIQWWLNDPRDQPQPDKATWRGRPVVVVVQPDGGVEEIHLLARASRDWDVLPEHYAVCRSCGELPPCREEEIEKETATRMTETLRLMAIRPGACMGCGETIGGRQKPVGFPGPNLWRPDLPDGSVRFHARNECSHWVHNYREQWEAAGKPGFVSAAQRMAMGEG